MEGPATPQLTRIGVFYDGGYFNEVSSFYRFHHSRRCRLAVRGLHEFIRRKAADCFNEEFPLCRVTEAHYYRARFFLGDMDSTDKALGERKFDEILMAAGITPHYVPPAAGGERGASLQLALDAWESALRGRFEAVALIAGDPEYQPLVRRLSGLGVRVLLLSWDIAYTDKHGKRILTRVAPGLVEEATDPILMHEEIEARSGDPEARIDDLFAPPSRSAEPAEGTEPAEGGEAAEAGPMRAMQGYVLRKIQKDEKLFGFLRGDDGQDYYFNPFDLQGSEWSDLEEGGRVLFDVKREAGPNVAAAATNVRVET